MGASCAISVIQGAWSTVPSWLICDAQIRLKLTIMLAWHAARSDAVVARFIEFVRIATKSASQIAASFTTDKSAQLRATQPLEATTPKAPGGTIAGPRQAESSVQISACRHSRQRVRLSSNASRPTQETLRSTRCHPADPAGRVESG